MVPLPLPEPSPANDPVFLSRIVEATVRVGVLVVLVAWCLQIVWPFVVPIIWGIIIAIAALPHLPPASGRAGRTPQARCNDLHASGADPPDRTNHPARRDPDRKCTGTGYRSARRNRRHSSATREYRPVARHRPAAGTVLAAGLGEPRAGTGRNRAAAQGLRRTGSCRPLREWDWESCSSCSRSLPPACFLPRLNPVVG